VNFVFIQQFAGNGTIYDQYNMCCLLFIPYAPTRARHKQEMIRSSTFTACATELLQKCIAFYLRVDAFLVHLHAQIPVTKMKHGSTNARNAQDASDERIGWLEWIRRRDIVAKSWKNVGHILKKLDRMHTTRIFFVSLFQYFFFYFKYSHSRFELTNTYMCSVKRHVRISNSVSLTPWFADESGAW
jgi:hypothetical protein